MSKNKVIIILLLVGCVIFSWMQFSYLPGQEKMKEKLELRQMDPLTHDFGKVVKYKNPYMGNNSNNANLFLNLPPMSDEPWTYALDSEKFTLTLNFEKPIEEKDRKKFEKAMLHNTTAAFALIGNLQIFEYSFPNHMFTVTRQRVNDWFGEDVTKFSNENIFEERVQQPLRKNIKLNEWVNTYLGGNS